MPSLGYNFRIAVIGLGYVGLPLAIELAKKYAVLGFDIDNARIAELQSGMDHTHESNLAELNDVVVHSYDYTAQTGLFLSYDQEHLNSYNTYIVTVPTPIDEFKSPDLRALNRASEMLGSILKKDDLVIYESTVYPGCTEEICVPVLEKFSGLQFNIDFFVGYSPERINPGDKVNTLTTIRKVTSGSTADTAEKVDVLYRSIITAGTHKAPSIKVAEASKAIENAQRDVNISFVNELALIFDRIGIDTNDVIEAAATKWNFLQYKPGLVGGHCIGVDPYYLAHKAQSLGYHPQVILSGRRVNDNMGSFVADKVVKLMIQKDHRIKGSRALIMGITFKENCPDVRNTRVVDIYNELTSFGLNVDVYDPWASIAEVRDTYGIEIVNSVDATLLYNAVVIAVAHREFLSYDFLRIKENNGVIYDTKAIIDRSLVDGRL
jgi:UDP-N-acetyl-D-galactosamine dehydrogenase